MSLKPGMPGIGGNYTVQHFIVLFCFMLFPTILPAQDSLKEPTVTINGYLSDMPGLMYNSISKDYEFSNQLHNRINLKWQPNTVITAALEIRSRLYYNQSAAYITQNARGFEQDAGVLKLSKNIVSGDHYLFNMSVDRLWVDFNKNKWQITVGRQRINWGQTFVWNPNDIFNTYNYLDFDYVEKPGSDAIRIQYYTSETAKAELVVRVDSAGKAAVAGLYRYNRWNYDFQFITGVTSADDIVIGGGWSGQLARGGFRGEASYFMPRKEFEAGNGTLAASIGWDYMFKNSLFLQTECLYNGSKADSSGLNIFDNNAFKISAKNPFLSHFSYFASVGYPVTPLINGSLAAIVNPENKVYILVPSLDYNILQNMDISLIAQLIGFKTQPEKLSLLSMWFLRLKLSF